MPTTLPYPPQGTPYVDPKTGQITEPWRRYLLALENIVTTGVAPVNAQYLIAAADAALTNPRNLGALASGYLKITTVGSVATPSSTVTIPAGDLAAGGVFPAIDGSNLTNLPDPTNLNADDLTSGTVPDARFPAVLPAVSGENLTNLPAPDLTNVIVNADINTSAAIAFSKLADGAALSVLGVTGNSAAANASIAAGADHNVLRRSGTAVGFGAVNLASSNAVTGRLPFANITQGSALSVLGVTGGSTADLASVSASADGQVLQRVSSSSLDFAFPATIYVERTLTAAEINSLNTTPIDLVAAAGATTVLTPIFAVYWATRTTSTFSVDPAFRVRWTGIATDLLTAVSMNLTSAAPPSPTDGFKKVNSPEWNPGFGTDPRNLALQISASADSTGGTGASVRIGMVYTVASF